MDLSKMSASETNGTPSAEQGDNAFTIQDEPAVRSRRRFHPWLMSSSFILFVLLLYVVMII